jgi:aminoglycoside 6'-N-acetyltransferase
VVSGAERGRLHDAAVPLDGRRIHLRPAEPADAAAFQTILQDPTVHPWWQAADPAEDARDLAGRDDGVAVWAIESGGVVLGIIQAHEETDPRYRHARWLIETRGHHRLTIDPAVSNERAIRAYRRVGFRPVGVMRRYEGDLDGTWHDGLLMDLLADELID